jgi:hypothetical protein
MALKDWEVNPKGVHELLAQPGVTAYLRARAEEGLVFARTLAPVKTGRYRDSLHVTQFTNSQGEQVVAFGSSSFAWHFVEYGSPHSPPRRVLSNAAFHVADRVELL